jgi:hypothetical protein
MTDHTNADKQPALTDILTRCVVSRLWWRPARQRRQTDPCPRLSLRRRLSPHRRTSRGKET